MLPNGEQKHVTVRVMKVALFDSIKVSRGIKVSPRNFEMQRPKHIRLKKGWKKTGVCMRVSCKH